VSVPEPAPYQVKRPSDRAHCQSNVPKAAGQLDSFLHTAAFRPPIHSMLDDLTIVDDDMKTKAYLRIQHPVLNP
jgi:hypothetical protein